MELLLNIRLGIVYKMPNHFPLAKSSHMDEPNISGVGRDTILQDALTVTWQWMRTYNPHTWGLANYCSQAKSGLWIIFIQPMFFTSLKGSQIKERERWGRRQKRRS